MGLLHKLFKSPAEDLLSRTAVGKEGGVDPVQSVQEMYGITMQTDATGPAQEAAPAAGPAASPQAPASSSPATAAPPSAPGLQPPAPGSPAPAPAPTSAAAAPEGEGAGQEDLDSPLRDLFTETSTMDPQLQALLGLVERVEAQDLLGELQEFSRALGAVPSDESPQV